jgi:ABC-type sugar transport system substrate-binding protein
MKIEQEKYYPNIKLVRIMINNDSYQKSYEITKYLLKSYPNLSSIVSVSPEATPAAAEAVTEVGNSKVKVLGLSLPHEIRNYINDGVIISGITWNPKELGFLTVSVAKSYLNGSVPIDQQKVPNVGNIKVLDNVITMGPPIIFSKENLSQYDF